MPSVPDQIRIIAAFDDAFATTQIQIRYPDSVRQRSPWGLGHFTRIYSAPLRLMPFRVSVVFGATQPHALPCVRVSRLLIGI